MIVTVNFSSKNSYSLKKFIKVFTLFCRKNGLNAIISQENVQILKKVNKFSILKSPHVNKTSQEQFEQRTFSRQVNICSFQAFKILVFLKRVRSKLFSDIRFQIRLLINHDRNFGFYTINPDNFQISSFLEPNQSNFNSYVRLFDIYGELALKRVFKKV